MVPSDRLLSRWKIRVILITNCVQCMEKWKNIRRMHQWWSRRRSRKLSELLHQFKKYVGHSQSFGSEYNFGLQILSKFQQTKYYPLFFYRWCWSEWESKYSLFQISNLLDIKVKSTFELKACLETTIWSFLRTFMRNLQLIFQKICRLNWLKFSMRSQHNVIPNIALFQRPERASHTKVVLLCHNCNHHDRVWFQFQFILIKTYSLRSLVTI